MILFRGVSCGRRDPPKQNPALISQAEGERKKLGVAHQFGAGHAEILGSLKVIHQGTKEIYAEVIVPCLCPKTNFGPTIPDELQCGLQRA